MKKLFETTHSARAQNLQKCFAFLDRPESPALLRAVIPTSISLIELTTEPKSPNRFYQLCALLGEGIIGTVWLHGLRDAEVMQASVDVLPALVKALGIGCARYLKVMSSIHPRDAGRSTLINDTSLASCLDSILSLLSF